MTRTLEVVILIIILLVFVSNGYAKFPLDNVYVEGIIYDKEVPLVFIGGAKLY